MEEAAEGIRSTLDELGVQKVFLAGLSMGGYVAFEFIKRHPERVRAAALIDTTARGDSEEKREKRQQTIKLIEAGKFDEVLALFVDSVLWPEGASFEPVRELMSKMGNTIGGEGFARSMAMIRDRGDFMAVVEHTTIPLLFMAGKFDEMTPPDVAAELASMALDGSFVEVPAAGHMSALENPKAVAQAVGEFYRRFMALA
jgi:pimeloyl-ACP methyl ester carboxylesterase